MRNDAPSAPDRRETADLPAPLSLTLDEAAKVAAGSGGLQYVSAHPWWWFGQAADLAVSQVSQVANPGNVAAGSIAAGSVAVR